MRKRRVLILSHLFPNETFPYEGTYVSDLIPHLAACGWDVEVAVPRDVLPNSRHLAKATGLRHLAACLISSHRFLEVPGHIPIHHHPYLRLPRLHHHYALWAKWLRWQVVPQLKRLHQHRPFDLLVGYGMMPEGAIVVHLGKQLGLPAVCYAIGSDLHSIHPRPGNREVVSQVLREATLGLTVSEDLRDIALSLTPQAHVAAQPVGVDLRFFHTQGTRLDLGMGQHLGLMTVFKSVKDPLLGFEAFRRLRERRSDVTLHVTGDGPLLKDAHQFVAQTGLQDAVRFYGVLERADMRDLLYSVDAAMLTSRREGTPRIILEALSLGTPFVATRVGGVPDLLPPELLDLSVQPEDAAALATALETVLNTSWDPAQLRAHAEQFSWPRIGRNVADRFEQALSLHASPALVAG